MKYARFVDNVAVDVVTVSPGSLFAPEIAAQFVAVPDRVCSQWTIGNKISETGVLQEETDYFPPDLIVEPFIVDGARRYKRVLVSPPREMTRSQRRQMREAQQGGSQA